MNRTQLIQGIINKLNYKSYLEIGCAAGDVNFSKINIAHKVGVDPNQGGTHRMTSDDYFSKHKDKFDIIFIDGLHHWEQVDIDVQNSLKCLNENGTIVMHDCSPPTERAQERYVDQSIWTGDCWKSLVKIRCLDGIDAIVGDFDYGCGILRVRQNGFKISVSEEDLTWDNLVKNKTQWLRLTDFHTALNWV